MGDKPNIIHLGDGAYAEFDGLGVMLRANDHRDEHCTDRVYIEAEGMEKLIKFYRMCMGE
ncbi:MAG: hypothetical protein ACTSPB_05575 [Candidatus Thorarchaeota archaeon]